jgi:hypothetical protein
VQCEKLCSGGRGTAAECGYKKNPSNTDAAKDKAAEEKAKAAQKNKTLNSNTMSNTQNAVPMKKK